MSAKPRITGRATRDWQDLDARHYMHPFTDFRALAAEGSRVITHAEGVHLYDSEGQEILDAMSGLWCVNIGYGRNELADAAAGPWRELVALRDFNPFAWNHAYRPDIYPWMRGMGTEPGRRGLNGGQKSWYFAPMRVGDVITNNVTLIDAYEKEGRLGTMLFLIDESRWTNQRDELVRIGQRTSIYY